MVRMSARVVAVLLLFACNAADPQPAPRLLTPAAVPSTHVAAEVTVAPGDRESHEDSLRGLAFKYAKTVDDDPFFETIHDVIRETFNKCLQSKSAPEFADCRAVVQRQFLVTCRVKLGFSERECRALMATYCSLSGADEDFCKGVGPAPGGAGSMPR